MKFIVGTIVFMSCIIHAKQILKDQDIVEIYNRFVKPNNTTEYAQRYVPLPLEKNNRKWRWENKDFPRVIALLEFERFVVERGFQSRKGLAINGLDPEWDFIPYDDITVIEYTQNPDLYDLHRIDLPEKDFDFVMVNQTIEHVCDPIRCLENIYGHMREGGILYFNVPANNIPHSIPFHYYTGITPVGVGAMVKSAGFKILSIGQWGNVRYLKKAFETQAFPDYRSIIDPGVNEMNCPMITWVFAVKE